MEFINSRFRLGVCGGTSMQGKVTGSTVTAWAPLEGPEAKSNTL